MNGKTIRFIKMGENFLPMKRMRKGLTAMALPSVETGYEHVTINESGAPVIAGTDMKVIELVIEKTAHGWSPEELHFQHPYLTLGQIYSALAYYFDHQRELDDDIDQRLRFVKRAREECGPSPLAARLKAQSSA